MRCRAGCILDWKASDVMITLARLVSLCLAWDQSISYRKCVYRMLACMWRGNDR